MNSYPMLLIERGAGHSHRLDMAAIKAAYGGVRLFDLSTQQGVRDAGLNVLHAKDLPALMLVDGKNRPHMIITGVERINETARSMAKGKA